MDRNVVIATVLIGLILLGWLWAMQQFQPEPLPEAPPFEDQATEDLQGADTVATPQPEAAPVPPQAAAPAAVTDSTIAGAQEGTERLITVETDLYRARFSTKGATLVSFTLKKYQQFDQTTPVQLVDTASGGALGLLFTTPSSHVVDTRSFFFEPNYGGDVLQVTDGPAMLTFTARVGQGTIRQTYTFTPRTYEVGLSLVQEDAASYSTPEGYELAWHGGVPFSESPQNRDTEAASLSAHARSGGEVEGIALTGDEYEEKELRGDISWIAVKNKYFTAVVIPDRVPREALLVGERFGSAEEGTLKKTYAVSMLMPTPTAEADVFRLYLGPLEFYRITKYKLGLYGMVDYGWDFFEVVTRPLAKFIFIPAFSLLSKVIPNYGLVIVLFAFLIKLLLFPLTKSSYKSMARMRELQPKMQEIKEKYADNPQKQQEATMKLYKETGVNPVGGCLPMVLQYPIIIALWQFLQQSIEIRQQGFLWANDLSAPDVVLNLPVMIPFYGDFVAGFTVLMGLSMILQMKIQATPSAGTQAKVMMYVMPVFIFVIFNRFPSGLSLYYLCYNIITAVQQRFINKSLEKDKGPAGANGKGSKKDAKAARTTKRTKRSKQKLLGKQVRAR